MGFSRQGYWSGWPFSSSVDLPDPWIRPRSLVLQVDSLPTELPGKPTEPLLTPSSLHPFSFKVPSLLLQMGTKFSFHWILFSVSIVCVCVCVCVYMRAHMCVLSRFWLFVTLCDSLNFSLPGSSVHGIFQARILEWVTSSYSEGSSPPRDQTCISCVSGISIRILYHCVHLKIYL